jgi:serine/threonine protein kinase, bacterial
MSPKTTLSRRVRALRATKFVGHPYLPSGLQGCPGYRLCECRGRGSFGEVWEALTADGRRVALKFMACEVAMAPREIRALQQIRQLKHPHLLQIEKSFCYSGYLVLVMELAEGSLLDLLAVELAEKNAPLDPYRACKYLTQAAEVLDFINARKHRIDGQLVAFRHCDVKPSNMLLTRGTLKLADFSLTVMTSSVTQRHPQAGSTLYAAPEVFTGTIGDRSDQYSLAVSYYELRTSQMLFPDSPTRFRRDYVRPAPDLTLLTPAERPIVSRALSQVTLDRWPSCVEFTKALAKAIKV